MENQEVKNFVVTEDELNSILQFIGRYPLNESLPVFSMIQGIIRRNNEGDNEPTKKPRQQRRLEERNQAKK